MNKTNTTTNGTAPTLAATNTHSAGQIICEPGAGRGAAGAVSTAYEAAIRVSDHATRHCAVDIGAKAAREHQRAFARAVNRLVRLLRVDLPDHTFTIRFLDSRPCAAAAKRNWDSHKQLAVLLTISSGDRVSYDVALSHSYGTALCSFVAQTTWPRRGCGWQEGRTDVHSSRSSKIMSYHARLILGSPASVYVCDK